MMPAYATRVVGLTVDPIAGSHSVVRKTAKGTVLGSTELPALALGTTSSRWSCASFWRVNPPLERCWRSSSPAYAAEYAPNDSANTFDGGRIPRMRGTAGRSARWAQLGLR
jgi:hypothetical protein